LGPGLAVGAGGFGARRQAEADAQDEGAGDSGDTGLGIADTLTEPGPNSQDGIPDVVVGWREADAFLVAGLLDVLVGEQIGQRGVVLLAEGTQHRAEGGPLGAVGIRQQRSLP